MPFLAFITLTLLPSLRLRQKKLGNGLHMTRKQYKLLQGVKRAHILQEKAKGTTKFRDVCSLHSITSPIKLLCSFIPSHFSFHC